MTDPAAETAADTTSEPTLAEQAAAAREWIVQTLADADAMRTEAGELEARAAALRKKAQNLGNTTLGREHEATELEARARAAAAVLGLEAKAADVDAKAQALGDELAGLLEQITGLDRRRDAHRAEQEQPRTQLAAALTAGDVEAVTSARSRIGSLDEILAALAGQRAGLQARVTAIGDSEAPGTELAAAAGEASRARAEIRRVLNYAFPDRPEAVHDREIAALEARRRHISEESRS